MKEEKKITRYIKRNLLSGSRCHELYMKIPNLLNFVNGYHFEFITYCHFDIPSLKERCCYSQIEI